MLAIRLIGGLRAERDGRTVELPALGRTAALLGWLALHPGRHPRARPAAQLWPDVPEKSARANLRSAVWALRVALGPEAEQILLADRTTLGLADDQVRVDVREIERLAAAGQTAEAAALCDGELLAGCDEDWVHEAREDFAGLLSRLTPEPDPVSPDAAHWTPRPTSGQMPQRMPEPTRWEQPLIGRDAELARLTECWRSAAVGRGHVVVLGGVGGIGKTRLCEELAAVVVKGGGLVAVGTASGPGVRAERIAEPYITRPTTAARTTTSAATATAPGGRPAGFEAAAPAPEPRPAGPAPLGARPLAVWSEALTDLITATGPVEPTDPWAPDLVRIVPAAAPGVLHRGHRADPQLEQIRLFEAVLTLITRVAHRQPLLLVLEDLHLAGLSSLDLIAYAARRIPRLPVLLLLTSRDRPAIRSPHTELRLKELSAGEIRCIATATADLAPDVVAQIADAAGGSPLIAIETALACARGLDPRGGIAEAARAATDRLSAPARRLVELIAVAGRDVTPAELRVFPLKETERTVAEAADLLRARAGGLGFRHALLAEAVYRQLPDSAHARLHEMFAEVLRRSAGDHRAAETAHHLRLAGLDSLAVGQLTRAAADARATAGLAEAAQFLREASSIDEHDADLFVEVAEVEAWRSHIDESDAAFARALELIPAADDKALTNAWLRRGRWMRGALCYPRESKRSYRSALDVLDRRPAADPDARAEALAGLAWAESVAGDPAQVAVLLEEIAAIPGLRQPPDDLLVHDIGVARAHALIRAGKFVESYGPLIAAGAAAGRAGRPDMAYTALINAASAAACVGDFERALDFADRCLPLVEPNGLLRLAVYVHSARGAVLRRLGRRREAAESCDREAAVAGRLGQPEIEGLAHYDQGMLAAAIGEHGAAADQLARALDLEAPVSRPHARLSRAESLARAGRLDEAEQELRATTAEPVAPGDFPDVLVARMNRVQGLVAAGHGDPATARRRLEDASKGWRRRSGTGIGDHYVAALIDLGRPPMTLLAEPDVELAAIAADLADLESGSEP